MISDPDLLILDEPTSGLDSHKVKSVIKVLKKLAV
jgi:ABC-type multidrug transport system ATPase subunit